MCWDNDFFIIIFLMEASLLGEVGRQRDADCVFRLFSLSLSIRLCGHGMERLTDNPIVEFRQCSRCQVTAQ